MTRDRIARDRVARAMSAEEREKGFTLVELMIIVIVIAILAALALPILRGQAKKGHDGTARNDLRNLVTSVEGYYGDTGNSYPTTNIYWDDSSGTHSFVYGGGKTSVVRSERNVIALYGDNRPGFVGYCAYTLSPDGTGAFYWYDSSKGAVVAGTGSYPSTPICQDINLHGSTN